MLKRLALVTVAAVAVALGGIGVTAEAATPVPKPGAALLTPPKFDPKTAKVVPVEDLNGKLNAKGQPIAPPNPVLAKKTLVSDFRYAGQIRSQANMIAVSTNSWIDKPSLDAIDHHSLAETSIHGGDGFSILEIGWVTNNDGLFASNNLNPHLFGSAWYSDGAGNSVWCGSYVGGCGYVDYSGNATDLGADLIGVRFTSKRMMMQYDGTADRWWLWYDTNWIGSWPSDLGHPQTPAFHTANILQNFGEVAYAHYPTCTDMGAGWMAVAGGTAPTSGAIFTTLQTATVAVPAWTTQDYTANVTAKTDPTKYGLVDTGTGGFKYGGPGSSPNPGACPTP
jgi:hypothetical protein